MKIKVLKVLHDTTVDGPGFRTSIYCAGCRHHCTGCHNPQSWDFSAGGDREVEDLLQEILSDPFADVTFSGGDPLYQAEAFALLAARIKSESRKNIWCYTGFQYEDLLADSSALSLLGNIDVLVDGPYDQEQKSPDLLFRGSANQRLIDVPASLLAQEVILWKPLWEAE